MKEIAIYGFGGFGREVACLIRKINERQPRWKFIGYFDDGHASGEDLQGLDYYVFHQANNFINTYLAKKLRLDAERIPSTIAKFGNTSSVSVPLTIASELKGRMEGDRKLLLSAFGVGMTWGTAVVPFRDLRISDLVEV